MKRVTSWKFLSLIVAVGVLLSPLVIAGTGYLLKGKLVLANERALKSVAEIHRRFQEKDPQATIAWTKTFTDRYDLFHYDVWVVDQSGSVLDSNTKQKLPYDWSKLPHPTRPGEISVAPTQLTLQYAVTILKTSESEYWIARYDRMNKGLVASVLLLPMFGISLLILASFIAVGVILFYLRKKARNARLVMADLKEGKLGSRFRVTPWDEAGELMVAFNEMASHVEHLVLQLRQTERTRTNLLRELSHDLRTPLFSARSMIEALVGAADRLTPEERQRCAKHAHEEMLYIQRLVEDLFFLAEMDEPGYRTGRDLFDLKPVIEKELEIRRNLKDGKEWSFETDSNSSYLLMGDPNSMVRLLRNAFDNANRFSRKTIRIRLQVVEKKIRLVIKDDGPGTTLSDRREFGKQRSSTLKSGSILKRDSLGLGSVIMRTVTEIHQGEISLRNWKSRSTGKRGGAQLTFVFPQAQTNTKKAA